MDRYENYFKPLLNQINYLFPDNEIIITVNGHVKTEQNNSYLSALTDYLSHYPNTRLISFEKPVGLSKLWNQIILNSNTEQVLLLNDDLFLAPTFSQEFINSSILENKIALINQSWSHFLISQGVIKDVGWFDERFLEIGGEDDDYAARCAIKKTSITNFKLKGITNYAAKLKFNSFGKDMTGKFRYSKYNTDFLNQKWLFSNAPFDQSVCVENRKYKYWRQVEGMDTPQFYDFEKKSKL